MDIDLNDLKIRREDEGASARRGSGFSAALLLVLFLASLGLLGYREYTRPAGAAASAAGQETAPAAAPDPASRPAPSAPASFSATGWVKLPNYHPVYVSPLVEGRLEEVAAIEGDRVARGQVVARLYSGDFALALAAAEGALAVAAANLANLNAGFRNQEILEARADVERLQALSAKADLDLERAERLAPSGALSREDLDGARAQAAAAAAALGQARQRLSLKEEGYRPEEIRLARTQVDRARAERDLAAARLAHCEIPSPMDGVVLERLAYPGQWVTPGRGGVLSLYDPADLEARIDVNQEQAGQLFLGQELEILTRAEPGRAHPARVVLIEPKADQVKNIVRVKAKLLSPMEGILLPEMVVQARFFVREAGQGSQDQR